MGSTFDKVEDVLDNTLTSIKKNQEVRVSLICTSTVDAINQSLMNDFLDGFTFGSNGKIIRPFKVIEYFPKDRGFDAKIRIRRKDPEKDEFKLYCQDIIHILNTDWIYIDKLMILPAE